MELFMVIISFAGECFIPYNLQNDNVRNFLVSFDKQWYFQCYLLINKTKLIFVYHKIPYLNQ